MIFSFFLNLAAGHCHSLTTSERFSLTSRQQMDFTHPMEFACVLGALVRERSVAMTGSVGQVPPYVPHPQTIPCFVVKHLRTDALVQYFCTISCNFQCYVFTDTYRLSRCAHFDLIFPTKLIEALLCFMPRTRASFLNQVLNLSRSNFVYF